MKHLHATVNIKQKDDEMLPGQLICIVYQQFN